MRRVTEREEAGLEKDKALRISRVLLEASNDGACQDRGLVERRVHALV